MIKITCVGGEYNGVERIPSFGTNPHALLQSMMEGGFGWIIDFSRATKEEVILWGGADLVARAVRAIKAGRPVSFLGIEYTELGQLKDFENAIVDSGYCVRVEHDDERGVVVGIVQPE